MLIPQSGIWHCYHQKVQPGGRDSQGISVLFHFAQKIIQAFALPAILIEYFF